MAMTEQQKAIKKIIKKTEQDMQALNVYKPEFSATIRSYAELRYLYDILNKRFMENGCKITEEYTNKSGATNIRKTAEYLAMETLRKDILTHETLLGLNPSGLKKIKADAVKPKRQSKLEAALNGL